MGHDDDRRRGLLPQREQLDVEAFAGQRVERAERLVEQEHRRAQGERPGERDPLAHPARQPVRPGGGEPVEADEPEQLVRPRLAVGDRRPGELERVGDIVERVPPRRRRGSWNTNPTAGSGPVTGRPSTSTVPSSAASSPPAIRRSVLLPLPFGPMTATTSFGGDLEVEPVERDERRLVGGDERPPDTRQADRRRAHGVPVGGAVNSRRRPAPARAARPRRPAGRPCRSAPTAGRGPAGRSGRRPRSGGRSAGAGRARR